ncbi:MurR/RpiR family transcriptional regulator [Roseobacter sp.]|uniref:MurR/RpiR family transcriptional regulator n=1 Tax=Roseobacter sp. TaxID=1907202 RepID=UPI0038581265
MQKAVYAPRFDAHFDGMSIDPTKPFLARVSDALPNLYPSERMLAELVLDFPGEMASYTASELAELADVSNATVSRFVRRIGYASFEEARRAVRDEQKAGTALLRLSSNSAAGTGAVNRHFDTSIQNLKQTYATLDDAVIDSLGNAMIAAPRVWFVGFRAGHSFAQYLGWQTSQVLQSVTVLPLAGETLAESLVSLGERDVVILIALRRKPKIVSAVASAARSVRAGLAVLEDRPSPDLADANWHLNCATSTSGPLMNHVGCMAVCNLLCARTIELSGAKGRGRMAAIEQAHRRFGEM